MPLGLRTLRLCRQMVLPVFAAAHPAVTSVRSVFRPPQEKRLATSGDAYVVEQRTADGTRWRFGTARVEKQVQFQDQHLALLNFTDRSTGHEYVQGASDVLGFTWNDHVVGGQSVFWTLDGAETRRLKQGELMLRLKLHTPELAVVKCYLLYPKESIIQEWLEITNRSSVSGTLADPASLEMHMLRREISAIDFTYMIGAPIDDSRYHLRTLPLAGVTKTFAGIGNREYSPIQVYQNRTTHEAVFVGWDYIGPWSSTVGADSSVHLDFRLRNYKRRLAPGGHVETPKAFTGVFHGDLDDMGHALLDYQYRYKWDYTRAPYFAGTEMEPTWAGSSWTGNFNPVTLYRQVFHMVDMLREVGADIYWRDNGWWDNQGDWNGPDWGETGRYLAQYDMRQVIYLPIQDVDSSSKVAKEHPDWIAGASYGGPIIDQSRPDVIDWELHVLESKRRQWGNFQWRKDWGVIGEGSDKNLEQDHGFRRLLTTFLDRNPGMVFHGCHTGAFDLGYEMLRMGVSWSMNDGENGNVGRLRGYYASYLYPPEKLEDLPDAWNPDTYSKAVWRGRLWNRFPTQGETNDPEKREGIRELFDIYHYLLSQHVMGRWGWVYHPAVTGDSATFYLERLSGDYRRGVIIPSHALKTPVTIYPKGLLPDLTYLVSYQESEATEQRSGTELMAHGISIPNTPDGELIYLNLPLHPGSKGDHTPPAAPTYLVQQVATHMDVSGVELRWSAGHDDNWVSYYQIYRNGVPLAKVAKGRYYFDHALGADPTAEYVVTTVDGSGNRSAPRRGVRAEGVPALVLDDTSHALSYTGTGWEHQTQQWVVAHGTQSRSRTAGDAVSYAFKGSRVTWYGRLGPENGVASVYLDGVLDRVVDTYDGNDTPNIALYSRMFPGVERHTIKIVVMGKHTGPATQVAASADDLLQPGALQSATSEPAWVVTDGLQVERTTPRAVVTGVRLATTPYTFTFAGRGVTWTGRRCEACGIVDVYVDGMLETSVDTYARPVRIDSVRSDEQRDVPLFTRRWVTPGRHTVKLVSRPDANLWATGKVAYLDALLVDP